MMRRRKALYLYNVSDRSLASSTIPNEWHWLSFSDGSTHPTFDRNFLNIIGQFFARREIANLIATLPPIPKDHPFQKNAQFACGEILDFGRNELGVFVADLNK